MASPQQVSCPQCKTQLDLTGLSQIPPTVRCGQCQNIFSTGAASQRPRWREESGDSASDLLPPGAVSSGASTQLPDLPASENDPLLPPGSTAPGSAPTGNPSPQLGGAVPQSGMSQSLAGQVPLAVDEQDDPRRRFRKRGLGIGANWVVVLMTGSFVVAAVVGGVLVLKGGVEINLGDDGTSDTIRNTSDASGAPITWIDASSSSARRASVKVKIDRIEFGEVRARNEMRQVQTSEDDSFFQVFLSIESQRARDTGYQSWYGNEFEFDGKSLVAELTDMEGNLFPMLVFSDALQIHGHTPSATLVEGRPIRDTIVFEIPEEFDIANSKGFRLQLPAAAYNEKGIIRFEIPSSMLEEARSGGGLLDGLDSRPFQPDRNDDATDDDATDDDTTDDDASDDDASDDDVTINEAFGNETSDGLSSADRSTAIPSTAHHSAAHHSAAYRSAVGDAAWHVALTERSQRRGGWKDCIVKEIALTCPDRFIGLPISAARWVQLNS